MSDLKDTSTTGIGMGAGEINGQGELNQRKEPQVQNFVGSIRGTGAYEDLSYQDRKKQNRLRLSTLTENVTLNHHKMTESVTVKHSIIDWVSTFKNLPRYPATIEEFITSGALYIIMEEIDGSYFKAFPSTTLPKNPMKSRLESTQLKKIYKHMLLQIELWFSDGADSDSAAEDPSRRQNSGAFFKPEQINLQRLIELQDVTELLCLLEFVLQIVVQCENKVELLNRFLEISTNSQEDMKELIEGAVELSEAGDYESQVSDSFLGSKSFRADLAT